MVETKLVKAVAASYSRSAADRIEVTKALCDKELAKTLRLVSKPPKVASSLKKAGVILVLTPEPLTLLPGAAMIGASYAMKRREPIGVGDLIEEMNKTIRNLQSFF